MMKRVAIFSLTLCLLLSFGGLWAEDLKPPDWRGDDRTIFVRWEFGTDNPNPMPDELETTLMDPLVTCAVTGSAPYTYYEPLWEGREGVWKYEDVIKIELSNFNEEYPLKEIWLQITYTQDEPYLDTEPEETSTELVQLLELENGWFHATYSIIIEPNPSSEIIYIQPMPCAQLVDEIVIDTICIPEPATLVMLGLGGLALLRKRRA